MSILTKQEREKRRELVGHGPQPFDEKAYDYHWDHEEMRDALDTIDALEAERDEHTAELSGLARESVRREIQVAKIEAETVALQRMFFKIHGIARANHDTRTVGGAHAALREILALIEGVDGEVDQ